MRGRRRAGFRAGRPVATATVVVGAVGGVGTSTLAALLARERVAAGRRVALVDLDVDRGGIDVLLGIEGAVGARWPDLARARGTLTPGDLDGLLPRWRGVEVLSGDRSASSGSWVPARDDALAGVGGGRFGDGALDAVAVPASRSVSVPVDALRAVWSGLLASGADVVADVPECALRGDPALADLVAGARVLVLTGQDVLGVAGAAAVLPCLPAAAAGLVLRRRPGARVAPAEAADALGLRLRALLPHDRGVAGATDRGLGPVVSPWSPLARAVRRLGEERA